MARLAARSRGPAVLTTPTFASTAIGELELSRTVTCSSSSTTSIRRGPNYLAIGFKLMYNEALPLPGVLFYARSRRIRVIHLIRENLLDIALSQMGTAVRRSVHAWSIEEREDLKIRVDITNLRWWLRHLERERLAGRWILRILGLDVLEITYESLRASDMPLHDVLRFLEVPVPADGELPARMLKLAPDSHRDGIANFDEVEACLRGTRFARFLRG